MITVSSAKVIATGSGNVIAASSAKVIRGWFGQADHRYAARRSAEP